MSTRKRTRLSVPNSGADGHYMRQTPSRSHYLSANWPTERAEKALAIESNRLYEEEVGLLRDALPSGIFGHVGSFVRGLGTGVAAGAFISKL